jgi:hypothetical protein
MNKIKLLLLAVAIGLFLAPAVLFAQSDPPPACCPHRLVIQDGVEAAMVQSEFFVSPTMLQLRGITRSQYIDQLSDSLFSGTQVTLGVSTTRTLSPADRGVLSVIDITTANEDALVAVQETRHYWLPRNRLNSEQLDKLDEVSITDGQVYIKIVFVERTSSDARLDVPRSQWR